MGLGLLSLAGCGDDRAAPLLVSSSATPPDAKCASGGITIQTGVDANGNGVLDADEVTSTQEVCSAGAPVIASLTATGADAQCPYGGTLYQSGADTNGNGKLDPSEVTSTQEVCDAGATQLSVATPLATGSVVCPLGGVETQTGLDDGAGGGIPGDGILQPGEVTATVDVCTVAPGYTVPPFAPPAAVAGQPAYTIHTPGGVGVTGDGGAGGSINLYKNGTRGGHVKVFATGDVDAGFPMRAHPPQLGATPFEVTADTTVAAYDDPSDAAIGEYYVTGGVLSYGQDAQHAQVAVTGLHVAAGATLTLPGGGLQALSGDIFIEGTVTAGTSDGDAASISLATSGVFVGAATGRIVATGAVAEDRGGDGGSVAIVATWILSAATIDTSGADANEGGDAESGGAAGSVTLDTSSSRGRLSIYNTGAIRANGGRGAQGGPSGAGGNVQLVGAIGGIHNSGAITAAGADGRDSGAAGNGVAAQFYGNQTGDVVNSGAIDVHGGDADPACSGTCAGGGGGQINWNISGGAFAQSASLIVRGGASVGMQGASAGGVYVNSYEGQAPNGTGPTAAGSIDFAGSIDSSGGRGASGGNGGQIQLQLEPNQVMTGQEIRFFGYSDFVTSGGAGVTSGGPAGSINFNNSPSYGECCDFQGTGGVLVYANLTGVGGSASGGDGGAGAQLELDTAYGQTYQGTSGAELVLVAGAITVDGGAGTTGGGNSGPIDLRGAAGVQASGAISSRGGAASADGGAGGFANAVNLVSGGSLLNHGAISAIGGASTGVGGIGGSCVEVDVTAATTLATSGAIACTGGDGDTGGAGGDIWIQSVAGSSNTGVCTVAGGQGDTAGAAGTVMVDGLAE